MRRLLGFTLVAVGLACLGYVGWELHGTTWISQHRAERAVADLEQQWADGVVSDEPSAGEPFAVVRIPRFGAEYAVPLVEGTSDEALSTGFGHLEGTAAPGEPGNVVLAGHRVTRGEPLRRMPELVAGDEVVIEHGDRVDTYVLDTAGADLVVPLTDTWVTAPRPAAPASVEVEPVSDRRLLTLITCAELFHTSDRLVAFGHLVSSTPR